VLRVTREAMGTEFQIVLYNSNERELERAANDALDAVQQVDAQMSLYRPDSELCWINAHAADGPVPAEPGLFWLLRRAAEVWEATEGAFDVTVGPLIECWRFFRGQGQMPAQADIDKALQTVGMSHVELDPRDKTVRFDRPGIRIDLGGIAKGFGVDRAGTGLHAWGVRSALIHGGWSTVYAMGGAPHGITWPVGIRHPHDPNRRIDAVTLRNEALSTSGSYEKSFEVDGVVYSHIMDPRTGWPAQGMLSASAITKAGFESDALSTAFFVMGVEKTRAYCESRPDIGAILIPDPGRGAEPEAVRIGRVR
jgi:thiamine biosynthesis lipoprotein